MQVRDTGFYNSLAWRKLSMYLRAKSGGRCSMCKKVKNERLIADHIIELTMENYKNKDISLNEKNIQILCLTCHNQKTFGTKTKKETELESARKVIKKYANR